MVCLELESGDANNDGTNEILFGAGLSSTGRDVLIAGSWKGQSVQWVSEDLDGPFHVAAGDVDLDGREEIVMASYGSDSDYQGGTLKVYDGRTHRLEWSTPQRFHILLQILSTGGRSAGQ